MKKVIFMLTIMVLVVLAGCAKPAPVIEEPAAPVVEEPVADGVSAIESTDDELSDENVDQDISDLDDAFSDW